MSKCCDICSRFPHSCLLSFYGMLHAFHLGETKNKAVLTGTQLFKAEMSSLPLLADNPENYRVSFCVSILIPVTDYNFLTHFNYARTLLTALR